MWTLERRRWSVDVGAQRWSAEADGSLARSVDLQRQMVSQRVLNGLVDHRYEEKNDGVKETQWVGVHPQTC